QQHWAELDPIFVVDRVWLLFLQLRAVNDRAVTAAKIFDIELAVAFGKSRVPPRDRVRLQLDRAVRVASDNRLAVANGVRDCLTFLK
ncbi:MAG: hypothetical protein ACI8P0_003176, partial [Planctomycetaceae bacterium]